MSGWCDMCGETGGCDCDRMMEALKERMARAIFDAAPFRSSAGPWAAQSREYRRMCRVYAGAAISALPAEIRRMIRDWAPEEEEEEDMSDAQLIASLRAHAYDDCRGMDPATHICSVAADRIEALATGGGA